LRIKGGDARKEMGIYRIKVAEMIEKARVDADILAKDNLQNWLTGTQKDTIDYCDRITGEADKVRAQAEILDIQKQVREREKERERERESKAPTVYKVTED
jgi:hypothetical protein